MKRTYFFHRKKFPPKSKKNDGLLSLCSRSLSTRGVTFIFGLVLILFLISFASAEINLTEQMALKKISSFYFIGLNASGIIDENSHIINVTVPAGTNVSNLIPIVKADRPVLVEVSTGSLSADTFATFPKIYYGYWTYNAKSAKKLALQNDKYVIINMGDSMTCDYCQNAEKMVFDKPEWKDYVARKGLSLFYSDFSNSAGLTAVEGIETCYGHHNWPHFFILKILPPVNLTNYQLAEIDYSLESGRELKPIEVCSPNNNISYSLIGDFGYRPGAVINNIRVPEGTGGRNPANFISILESFTGPIPDLDLNENRLNVTPASGIAQDFTNPVKYTITALDGSSVDYTVKVQVYSDSCASGTFCSASGVLNATNQNVACASGMCYKCDAGFYYDSGLRKCITGICSSNPGCLNENFIENSTINSNYCAVGKCFSCNANLSYNTELKKCITGICNSNPGCLNESFIENATFSLDYCSVGKCFSCSEGMSYDSVLKVCKFSVIPSNFTEIVLDSSDLNSGKDNLYDLGTIINVSSNDSFGRIYVLDLSTDNLTLGLKVNNFSRFTTSIGNEIALDLNDDSNIDVSLLFSGISEGKPKVSIKKFSFYEDNFEQTNVNENNFEQNNSVSENSNVEEENLDSLKITFYVLVGLIFLIIISLIVFYLVWFFRFRKKEEKENVPMNQNISPVAYQGRFARR